METVRVDVRKLQILNDRINQTIDALSQLRQSVHAFQPGAFGIQHSSMGYGVPAFGPQSYASALSAQALASQPYANALAGQPFGVASQSPWFAPAGLSHSSFSGAEMNPWAARFIDQATALRLSQSFPYAFSQIPPVVAI